MKLKAEKILSEDETTGPQLLRMTRLYAALVRANEAILRIEDRDRLFGEICDIVVEQGGLRLAAVWWIDPGVGTIHLVTSSGDDRGYLDAVQSSYADAGAYAKQGLMSQSLREDSHAVSNDLPADPVLDPWRDAAVRAGVRSAGLFPLRIEEKIAGWLCVYSAHKEFFDAELVLLLKQIAGNVSFALDRAERESARHRAEEARRESETRFRSLIGLSFDVYWEQDEQFRFTLFTGTGQSAPEPALLNQLMGRTRWEVGAPNMSEADWAKHIAAVRAHEPFRDLELARIDATGAEVWISISGEPVFDAAGVFRGYRGMGRNITERKQAEQALRDSNERFDIAARATSDVIWDWDIEADRLWWNDNFSRVFGHEKDSTTLDARFWISAIHPDDRDGVVRGLRQAIESGLNDWGGEYRFRRRDGSYAHVLDRRQVIRDATGKTLRMIGALTDVTAQKEAEETIRDQALKQQLIAEFGQRALASSDLNEVMREAVELVRSTLKVDYADLCELEIGGRRVICRAQSGRSNADAAGKSRSFEPDSRIALVLSQSKAVVSEDLAAEPRFGNSLLLAQGFRSGIATPILGAKGTMGVLGAHAEAPRRFAAQDVSFVQTIANLLAVAIERKSAEERLAYLAQFDPLTGLPNRHLFRDRLTQAIGYAQRNGWPIAVLFIDLDHFKQVNDTRGHAVGDRLLQQAAKRIAECLRGGDTVGRLGGDEFAAVLPDAHRPGDIGTIAGKIIGALGRPFDLDGSEVSLSACVGVALYPIDASDAATLIANAEAAMLRAKDEGRNNYQFFAAEMNERSLRDVESKTALRRAFERSQLQLHFQPVADIAGGRICGVEALLRWAHPKNGLILPGEFIPALETSGLMIAVGDWVLQSACAQAKAWQASGLSVPAVSVNLSSVQFQQDDVVARVRQALEKSGLDPALLQLEIPETLLMGDLPTLAQILKALKALGVGLAVDNFGTGYSSLGYLKRYALDTLKIDRSFIRDIPMNSGDASLVQSALNLAHDRGMKVVAEGVETGSQLDFLALNGCEQMQGFFFSKAVAAEELARMLGEDTRLSYGAAAGTESEERPILLLLDDSEEDNLLLEQIFQQHGRFDIVTTTRPERAFEMLATRPVAIVISDYNMPGMNGIEFLREVRRRHPQVVRIIATGGSDPEIVPEAINQAGIDKFLSKNWDFDRLRGEVREAHMRSRAAVHA